MNTVQVPRETWDAMREALEQVERQWAESGWGFRETNRNAVRKALAAADALETAPAPQVDQAQDASDRLQFLQALQKQVNAETAKAESRIREIASGAPSQHPELEQLRAENERLTKNNGLIYIEVLQLTNERDALQAKLDALQAQEPVGTVHVNYQGPWASLDGRMKEGDALYAAPVPAQPKQPLTNEQLRDVLRTCPHDTVENLRVRWLYAKDFARAIESAHGITGEQK